MKIIFLNFQKFIRESHLNIYELEFELANEFY
jgi:hypothetical protein